MAKNKAINKREEELEHFDFCNSEDSHSDEAIAGMMSGMIEASHHQQTTAIELTKLVVSCRSSEKMEAKDVFAIFMQASQVAQESTALKELWERFNS